MSSNKKLPLPDFLKVLTNAGMQVTKAMIFARKVYSQYNTPENLGLLTDSALVRLGIDGKDDRKTALAAFREAGFVKPPQRQTQSGSRSWTGTEVKDEKGNGAGAAARPRAVGGSLATKDLGAGSSSRIKKMMSGKTSVRKRKRDDDLDELLPSGSNHEGTELEKLEFNEVLDEETLRTKFAVVNRAPVMALWSTIVAEQLGFKQDEALSIASAYTEMNAISKGVSLGIFDKDKGKGIEITKNESQPYVDLMGRRPLYKTKSDSWRALLKGEPIDPGSSYKYITSSFRQTLPYIAGALRLLAQSFEPSELNTKGFGLYADFRPEVDKWGERASVRCERILGLRSKRDVVSIKEEDEDGGRGQGRGGVEIETKEEGGSQVKNEEEVPVIKKAKMEMEGEELYEIKRILSADLGTD